MIVKTLLEASNTNSAIAVQADTILNTIEQSFREALELAKIRGELKPDTDCPRLARLLQTQIIGLRSFAQRDTAAQNVTELAEDMAAILEQYRARH